MEMLSMLLGGGHGLLDAALLVCLFWAALVRPERIRSLLEFRLALVLLGLSIMAPMAIQLTLAWMRPGPAAGRFGMANQDQGVGMYFMVIPSALTMLAVLLGVDSVLSTRKREIIHDAELARPL